MITLPLANNDIHVPPRKSPRDVSPPAGSTGLANRPLRVLLVGDSDADVELIVNELQNSDMSVRTQRVDSAESFTAALGSFAPDVVLADHALPQFESRAALEILRQVRPATPLIVVTGALSGSQSVAVIRAGAEDLVLTAYLSRLPGAITHALEVRRGLQRLTDRQVEVLRMVAEGHRTRDIANRLGLSVKTVESHRGEIMKRLQVHDLVGLVRYAIRVGLIPSTLTTADQRPVGAG
jgi:DNA-binding NarL/FixJ family response regulator